MLNYIGLESIIMNEYNKLLLSVQTITTLYNPSHKP